MYKELAYTRHKLHQSHINTRIYSYHEEEKGPTTDENKRQKKNDVHPCYPRLPAWNPSQIDEEEEKEEEATPNEQSTRSRQVTFTCPATGVVVICEPQGTQQSHFQRYQDQQSLMGEVWLSGEVAAAAKHIFGG